MSTPGPMLEARLPPELAAAVAELAGRLDAERVAERVRSEDATLWAPAGTPEVANRLGWLTIAARMRGQLDEIEGFAAQVREAGYRDVVLLGMGGSSLAPEVLRRSFTAAPGDPKLHVLDSTDAATVKAIGDAVDPGRSLFLVSSKSGGTIEPLSMFAHFHSLAADGTHFAAITDPGSGLGELAAREGFRHTFLGDPDIGGRYSALSPFGIVPATLIGLDSEALLAGAESAWAEGVEGAQVSPGTPAAVWLGAALGALARAGRDKLTFVISETLPGLGLWLEQLVAESTGKQGTGILPVAEEPLGEPAVYGSDRVFAYLPDRANPDPELDRRVAALADQGHPLVIIPTDGPRDLGRIFMLAEIAVAVAGWALAINPFDQPNVQQAKDATKRVLGQYESDGRLPAEPVADDAAVRELLTAGSPPEYVALMAYTQPTAELDAAVAELRGAIRAACGVTTTFGYGPRFLHSTGQFHKGGPRYGRFLQLLHDGPEDVPIPGSPYGFTTLKHAQALGDLETLRDLPRPALSMRLSSDAAASVRELTRSLGGGATTGR